MTNSLQADPHADTHGDAALWQRAASGNKAAFGELFERHAQAVWNHAFRLTGSWSLAEDLTSMTFLTAWRKLHEVTLVRDSALPWLYAVAGNLARTEFRSAGRFTRLLRRIPAADTVEDHAESVAEKVDGEGRMRLVLAAIAKLPKAERQAAELCLVGEVSIAAAAELLGLEEVSIRSRVSRARARLRRTLGDDLLGESS
ncbi:RNA polymerase sigma factor [Kibdelosporangium phytohabitans]|uniref:RNA polymerase subunit sigma-70 n=1 Tax=Kibdelosporangium phytohabitans TaxID=860235 RepID=A0A0N9I7B4_9PSEU|nr:RNA polymerase sigma factor [Kibdelosporangium phytohabitans]ALG11668.1 RNA polymerase subunit sigma-70 [Kibdelosporangium phytohabitans]MBE1463055.1 RNA polymerase sigma-70 factor (ECF subfamily) [Kibdelosporangium phytohabitans]